MILINQALSNDFDHHDALFLSADGVIVDVNAQSPLMPFKKIRDHPQVMIDAMYLDGSVLCVRVSLLLPVAEFEQSGRYRIVLSKALMAESSHSTMKQILRATHWLTWEKNNQYCRVCGHGLKQVPDMLEKKCVQCECSFFPNLAPAIIVAIKKGDEILLARGFHFNKGVYSALAGFVDVGESAEEAVHREVKEEVGVTIKSLAYVGSQSWPFPGSFMMAFIAEYDSGEIQVDGEEIEDAQWFRYDALPDLPSSASIANQLIQRALSSIGGDLFT